MPSNRYPSVLLFGAPGVGKGTQGAILGHVPGFFHLSTGEMFRRLDPQSELGRRVAETLARGELVSDNLTLRIWQQWLDQRIEAGEYDPSRDLLVLDGIPRSRPQAERLEEIIDVRLVLHLLCADEDALVERIKGRALTENRTDDADESVIRRRFDVYRAESAAILGFYPPGRIAEIDPLGTPAEVLRRVLDEVIPVQKECFGG